MPSMRTRGILRLTDRIIEAYYEGDDRALGEAIEAMAHASRYDQRLARRAAYRRQIATAAERAAQKSRHARQLPINRGLSQSHLNTSANTAKGE